MIPCVTVQVSSNGFPMAKTAWPMRIAEESPNVAGCSWSGEKPSARMTARSLPGSVPTTFASEALPSYSVTFADVMDSTTW